MGYAYYEWDGMKRGYAVPCKCHQRGCQARIDRGLAFLCYRCTWYFCATHLFYLLDDKQKQECFAGESTQVCGRCAAAIDKEKATA